MLIRHSGGRLLVNRWPTGVGIVGAMMRTGTFLATWDGPVSLETVAMERFLRPVGCQNFVRVLLQGALIYSAYWVAIPQSGDSQ
jgi:NADP-dependent aldehyde dehydrogenase